MHFTKHVLQTLITNKINKKLKSKTTKQQSESNHQHENMKIKIGNEGGSQS